MTSVSAHLTARQALPGLALLLAALAACATPRERLRDLPAPDRDAWDACALKRCGPAPQYLGEATWAMDRHEREMRQHAACWDEGLDAWMQLGSREERERFLAGHCAPRSDLQRELETR